MRDGALLEEDSLALYEELSKIFLHPFSLIWRIGDSLIINGVNIYSNMAQAIHAYETGDYETFGELIGESLILVFSKCSTEEQTTMDMNDKLAYQTLNGILSQITQGFHSD